MSLLLKTAPKVMDDETIGLDETSFIEEPELDTLEETEVSEEETIDWKAEAEKAKEIARNQEIRAKKAEQEAKAAKQQAAPTLGTTDLYALMQAQVPQEDVQEVQDYAAYKKISIAEALKAPAVKSLLAEAKEARDVANATNTGRARRQVSSQSGDSLLEDANKGKLPDTEAGLTRLAEARLERKRDALKRT